MDLDLSQLASYPNTPEEAVTYLRQGMPPLLNFCSELAQMLDKTNVAPPKPSEGSLKYADGSNWNPGSGAGLYRFTSGSWVLQIPAAGFSHVHSGADITSGTVVDARIDAAIARLASPTFTGDPKVPTAAPGDNDTSAASTAFVTAAIAALIASNFVKITDYTVASGGENSINFTAAMGSDPAYLLVWEVAPETDNTALLLRLGTGGSYDAGASDYVWMGATRNSGGGLVGAGSTGDTAIGVSSGGGVGNAASEIAFGFALILYPGNTNFNKNVIMQGGHLNASTSFFWDSASGYRATTNARTDVQLLFASGQIAQNGRATLYKMT